MSRIDNTTSETSLDTLSLKLHSTENSVYRLNLIRDNYQRYNIAHEFYQQFNDPYEFSKYNIFMRCRSNAYFAREKTSGRVSIIANSCHLRWCPFCARTKTNIIRRNTTEWLKNKNFPKFLTFTLAHADKPLSEQIQILYESFKQLRRIKMFKKAASNGVWFLQITKSTTDELWHPHLHVITYGAYIPARELSREWHRITGTSFIVDIRAIKDQKKAADYVARYASQTCDIAKFSLDELWEIDQSLKKHRVCGSWGSAKKAKLTVAEKFEPGQWQFIGKFSTVIGLMSIDNRAKQIYEAYKSGQTIDDGIDVCGFDCIRKGEPPPEGTNYEVEYDDRLQW